MEILSPGSLSPRLVLDLLLRGKAAIPGVEVIGERIGSRGVVLGLDADTVYAVRAGTPPAEALPAALQDLDWLIAERSLVRAIVPRAARPRAGILLAADLFPPGFSSLLPLLSFPCRLFRSIALRDQASVTVLFEPYPPQMPEAGPAPDAITAEEERFFSSW